MKKRSWIYFVITFLVLFGIIYGINSSGSKPGQYDSFAQCLSENGAKMYGTDWCHFCQNQKNLFGKKSFENIDYVNCDFDKLACSEAGIQGYPTWVVNGESYSGVQSLGYLAVLTGCELNEE